MLTNSFGYDNLVLRTTQAMFNLGFKKDIKRKRVVGQQEQMTTQVKKILGQRDQGLILMVKDRI